MSRLPNAAPAWMFVAMLMAGPGFARPPIPIEPVAPESISDLPLSPFGESLLAMNQKTWVHGKSPHFVLHAQEEHELYRAAEQAEFVWAELDRWFDAVPAGEGAHLFLISDTALWQQLATRHGWPGSAQAAHVRGELFVLRTRHDLAAQLAIPHELVHLRVYRLYGEGVPYWAEEGLAEVLGWRLADAFHRWRYRRGLTRLFPPLSEDRLLTWQELTQIDHLPDDPASLEEQIRQIRSMSKTLLESGGDERLKAFIAEFLERRAAWPAGAVHGLGFTPEALQELETLHRRRLMEEKREGWPAEVQADAHPAPPPRPRSISGR